ncbi:membrane protein YqaA with SNARE-associated domain [Rhodoligotrophos appendicifer]|uniref:YqaA family protein n=1 Tax=Rhodoligotrophos appendicifer TaxID=987056 RepID=UPI00117EB82A|nr:YqaA family protein [Rhodoligotrophos appendicifer]
MLRKLYDRMLVLAEGPNALWALAVVSFTEASFFPVPPDPVLAAIVLSRPQRAWLAAAVCTLASVVGALFGYLIGLTLYDLIGQPIIDFYGIQNAFDTFRASIQEWGGWIIVAKGLTPIPFKLVTIASGVAQLDLLVFVVACALTRGARFFLVAGLFYKFGPAARQVIDNNFNLVMVTGVALVILGFVGFAFVG